MHSPITPTTSAPPASAREELPAKSRVFCMAPWVGLNLNPSGDVYPCCYYVHENPVGRLADSSVEAIRNSTAIKELRKNMLAGEPSPGCRKCYAAEAMGSDTARTHMNKTFSGLPEAEALLASTAPDGSLTREEILFLDVQFSNVCNFRCRICGPRFSSSWRDDFARLNAGAKPPVMHLRGTYPGFWESIAAMAPHLKEIYLWGGEPLLMPEHSDLLKLLRECGNTSVRLRYITNLSHLRHGAFDVVAAWKDFPNVWIGASLDGTGAQGEFMRKGQVWAEAEANALRIRREVPHAYLFVSCTVSAMNAWNVTDFHRDWIERGFIDPNDFCVNLVQDPHDLRPEVLPPAFRLETLRKTRRYIDVYLAGLPRDTAIARQRFGALANRLETHDGSRWIPRFLRKMSELDGVRGESWEMVFPELAAAFAAYEPRHSAEAAVPALSP